MKRIIYLFFIIPLFWVACGEDDIPSGLEEEGQGQEEQQEEYKDNEALVATWSEQYDPYEYFEFTFYENNRGLLIVYYGPGDSSHPFSYQYDKNAGEITFLFDNELDYPYVCDIEIASNQITLSGGFDMTLYKTDGQEKPNEGDGDSSDFENENYLAGQWMNLDATHIFSFSKDKTGSAMIIHSNGTIDERSFTYKYNAEEGSLRIDFNDKLEPNYITFDISLSGAANTMMELTCTSGNFENLTLWGGGIES